METHCKSLKDINLQVGRLLYQYKPNESRSKRIEQIRIRYSNNIAICLGYRNAHQFYEEALRAKWAKTRSRLQKEYEISFTKKDYIKNV